MSYIITQKFITMNRSHIPFTPIGDVVHETADPNATDENEQQYYNNGYRAASAHAFVDRDSITQTVPWNEVAYHAGHTANFTRLGIELCHYNDLASFLEVWNRAVWLFAYVHIYVLKQPIITKDNLMSHAEVSNKWHETDHIDPIAYFKQFGKTVDDFRQAVQNEINSMLSPVKEVKRVKDLVVWNGNEVDEVYVRKLAKFLKCPFMLSDIPFDYTIADHVYCVGAPGTLPFTSYATKIFTGANRDDTEAMVDNFIANYGK